MKDTTTVQTLGEYLRERRTQLRKATSQLCKEAEVDISNYSKTERDLLVPSDEALMRIGSALGFEPGTPEMEKLMDLAWVERHRVPDDLAEERELKALLPVFYQRLRRERGNPTTGDGIYQRLLDTLREG